jgi:hypothetical protein
MKPQCTATLSSGKRLAVRSIVENYFLYPNATAPVVSRDGPPEKDETTIGGLQRTAHRRDVRPPALRRGPHESGISLPRGSGAHDHDEVPHAWT